MNTSKLINNFYLKSLQQGIEMINLGIEPPKGLSTNEVLILSQSLYKRDKIDYSFPFNMFDI